MGILSKICNSSARNLFIRQTYISKRTLPIWLQKLNSMSSEKRAVEEVENVGSDDNLNSVKKQKLEDILVTDSPITIRVKRKMFVVLLSYCGTGYYGMQRNPGTGFPTIEGELLSALLSTDLIDRELHDHPQEMWFQRAARTDKGVSAARQIVCMRLPIVDDMVSKINKLLPEQIRVIAMKRATNKFNAKTVCDARTYSYIAPTFAFASVDQITSEEFRIKDEQLKEIQSILDMYKGSHFYHNFTSGRKAGEDSARRYIIDFTAGQPFIRQGIEFVTLTVKGQSFMLHQIRKMVAMVITIMRGFSTKNDLKSAHKVDKMDIPIAPGLGLILETVHYDRYNKKYLNDGIHEQIIWDEYDGKIQEMKDKFIYRTIIEQEVKEKSMLKWLETIHFHNMNRRSTGSAEHENPSKNIFDHAVMTLETNYDASKNSDDKQAEDHQTSKINNDAEKTTEINSNL